MKDLPYFHCHFYAHRLELKAQIERVRDGKIDEFIGDIKSKERLLEELLQQAQDALFQAKNGTI